MAYSEIDKAVQKLVTMTGKKVEIKKVWENASPTSVFAAQTVKVDTTGAKFAIIPYLYARNYVTGGVGIVDWHNSSISFAENYNMFRHALLTDSGVQFSAGKIALTYANQKDDNERVVPTEIYIVKGVN